MFKLKVRAEVVVSQDLHGSPILTRLCVMDHQNTSALGLLVDFCMMIDQDTVFDKLSAGDFFESRRGQNEGQNVNCFQIFKMTSEVSIVAHFNYLYD